MQSACIICAQALKALAKGSTEEFELYKNRVQHGESFCYLEVVCGAISTRDFRKMGDFS
jgi:hypothetical protein